MTTFGALLLAGVGVTVVAFFVVAARGRRLRAAEENGKKHETAARLYVESRNKIADFGALMEREPLGPLDVADESRLPHPKDDLIAALRLVVLLTADRDLRQKLNAGALCLAQYQPGVGPEMLKRLHLPSQDALKQMNPGELAAIVLAGGTDAGRWQQFNELVDRDITRIAAIMSGRLPPPSPR